MTRARSGVQSEIEGFTMIGVMSLEIKNNFDPGEDRTKIFDNEKAAIM